MYLTLIRRAHLEAPIDLDRGDSFSTLITTDNEELVSSFRVLASYNPEVGSIGDLRVFKLDVATMGSPFPKYEYYGAVPASRVKSYRFAKTDSNGEPEPFSEDDAKTRAQPARQAEKPAEGRSGRA